MSQKEWPGLPDGPGTILLSDVEVDISLEAAFILLHGGFNEFRKKMTAAVNNQNYANTGWLDSIDTALAAPPSPKVLDTIANLKPGMAYKATFLTSAMGSMCQTTELGRIVDYTPEKSITVDGTICTAAKYGETFRPVSRRIFESLGPTRTRIKTLGAVVFISSVNGMIKGMIQKGSIQGMRDTFAKMETVISEYGKIQPYQEAGGVTLGLPPSSAVPTGAKELSPLRKMLETIIGTTAIEALDPWASFLYAALAHLPFLGGMTSDTVLCAIVVLLSFEIVRACLLVLKFCASAGRHPQDTLSWVSLYIFKYIYVPQSVHEVFTTVLIALFARQVMARFVSFIPQPPSGGSRPSSAAGNHCGGAGDAGEGQTGVKYDGYGKAIAGKNNDYVGKGNNNNPLGALDDKSEVALEHIRQGLVNIGKIGQSNRVRARQQRQEKHEKIVEKMQERRQKHDKNKEPGVVAAVETVVDDAEIAAAAAADWAASSAATAAIASGMSSPLSGGEFGLSPRSPTTLQYDAEEAALLEDPHHLSTEGYSGPELTPQLRSAAVVESLFENERLQPFRGWGHTWPGHFLPTDRVLHWSMNDPGQEPDSVCSQSINEVAPLPPPGWRWVEKAWHLDLSGVFSDSTDNDGWSYGLDFPWVVYPFVPGTGRKKMADFVRRRRWLRTRVPIFVQQEVKGESSSTAVAGENEGNGGTTSKEDGAESRESGGSNSSSSSTGGGGVAEALQQSISMPFGSAVEELEVRPSEEVAGMVDAQEEIESGKEEKKEP